MGKLYVVGIGPGSVEYMTLRAYKVLQEVEVVVGYDKYVSLIRDLVKGKEVYVTGMREEAKRCKIALEEARKCRNVALVCGGDPEHSRRLQCGD